MSGDGSLWGRKSGVRHFSSVRVCFKFHNHVSSCQGWGNSRDRGLALALNVHVFLIVFISSPALFFCIFEKPSKRGKRSQRMFN